MYMCRNLTGRPEELKTLALPGELGLYECDSTEAGRPCYQKFVERCSAILGPWRAAEARKTVGKVFTSLFILLGMGVLGACSTAQHSTAQYTCMHGWTFSRHCRRRCSICSISARSSYTYVYMTEH